jgi:putative CocE/NonD family hydrolase
MRKALVVALALLGLPLVALEAQTRMTGTVAAQTGDWRTQLSQPEHEVRTLVDMRVPMRDGVELSADIYLPKESGRWPVILKRTPYGNHRDSEMSEGIYFAERGYAVVIVDNRGRHDSDGAWYPWFDDIDDGHDTVEWAGTQPWSTGNVGMVGGSYGGLVQWWAAASGSPYLKAIAPFSAHADIYYYGMNYRGGAFKLMGNLPWALGTSARVMQAALNLEPKTSEASRWFSELYDWPALMRHLPILTADSVATGRPVDFYRDWIRHSSYDDYWKEISNYGKYQNMDLPVLQIGGWFDVHVVSMIANVEGIQRYGTELARKQQKLVMGPWVHGSPTRQIGDLDFGPEAVIEYDELRLRWMDRWLKGVDNGADEEPALKLFTMGINQWQTAERWPLPETEWTRFYLHSNGRANSFVGDGRLTREEPVKSQRPDTYTYDPEDPVPTLGDIPWDDRPIDYRPIERRDDVLVYTTDPLTESLEVTGPVQARIYASSSATDTDWTVRLLDVYPNGRSINVTDGILRARFREPAVIRTAVPAPGQFEHPELMKPGEVYEFTIEVGVTSIVFLEGHRIRIEVSSSNFPRFDRNLNNGGELGIDARIMVANQTVYHDPRYPSHIELPVIPR